MAAALAALLAAVSGALAPHARADGGRDSCASDLESGLKLLALAEKGDLPAAKRAWETFESAERRCPDDVRFPFFGGLSHVYGEDPVGAAASLTRLRSMLAVPLRELNRPESEVDLNSHVLFLRAAYNFRLRREAQAAAEQLNRVRMRDPGFYPSSVSSLLYKALIAWGADLEHKGDLAAAIAQTRRAKEEARYDLDPKRRDLALRNLAQYHRMAEEWTEAQAIALDLAARYPKDAVIHYLLASIYADQFQFDRAAEQWKSALDILAEGKTPPEDAAYLADAPMRYGISLASNNQAKEGIARIEEFSAKNPKDARPHFYLGKILWELLSKGREARDQLEKAYALDPLCPETISLLFNVYEAGPQDASDDKAKLDRRVAELRALLEEGPKKERAKELAKRRATILGRTNGCQ